MGGRTQVALDGVGVRGVVVRDGCLRWHADQGCDVRDAREGGFAFRCTLADAHASRLVPCPACATDLATLATTVWGPRTAVERARLPLPRLVDLGSGTVLLEVAAAARPARTWGRPTGRVGGPVAAHP